jgi:hypothetical protein
VDLQFLFLFLYYSFMTTEGMKKTIQNLLEKAHGLAVDEN